MSRSTTPTRRRRKQRSSAPPRSWSRWTSSRSGASASSAIRKAPRSGSSGLTPLPSSLQPAAASRAAAGGQRVLKYPQIGIFVVSIGRTDHLLGKEVVDGGSLSDGGRKRLEHRPFGARLAGEFRRVDSGDRSWGQSKRATRGSCYLVWQRRESSTRTSLPNAISGPRRTTQGQACVAGARSLAESSSSFGFLTVEHHIAH